MRNRKNNGAGRAPLLRVRHLVIMTIGIALLIAAPLCIVWKQAYITQLSIRRVALADSVAVLTKQAAQLHLSIDKLSATERIETIARERLELEYPAANRIVIVKQNGKNVPSGSASGFFAVLLRSISGGRG